MIAIGHTSALIALLQVILIDLTLAGDNAVVIGMAAARVPKEKRRKAIFWGLAVAVILRIVLAVLAATILTTIGLMFAGGILLLWVSWRLWRDIKEGKEEEKLGALPEPTGSIRRAMLRIVIADLSMSLDNVLAVAGAAMEHVWVLTIGLLLSVALMGIAASFVARLLTKHPWISYAGLILVMYVAIRMVWFGGLEIWYATAQNNSSNTAVALSYSAPPSHFDPARPYAIVHRI